jgi:hypothetical protein
LDENLRFGIFSGEKMDAQRPKGKGQQACVNPITHKIRGAFAPLTFI